MFLDNIPARCDQCEVLAARGGGGGQHKVLAQLKLSGAETLHITKYSQNNIHCSPPIYCRAQVRHSSVLDVWRSESQAARPRVHRCGVTALAGAFVRQAGGGIKEASRTCLPPGVSESAFVAESS
jgi:hypothetical protein